MGGVIVVDLELQSDFDNVEGRDDEAGGLGSALE